MMDWIIQEKYKNSKQVVWISRGAQNVWKQKQKAQTSKEWDTSIVVGNDVEIMTKDGVKYHNIVMVGLTFQTSEHGKRGY